MRSIYAHNCTDMVNSGESYTDNEFRLLDPVRFFVSAEMHSQLAIVVAAMGAEMETGLGRQQEKWTRGENIGLTGILVDFDGSIWLEVKNNGGGACTTLYFEQNHPKVGWIGTRGKPEGFKEAPNASDRMSLQQLRIVHDRIVNHNDRSVHNAYL
jgi:hypothetical protein